MRKYMVMRPDGRTRQVENRNDGRDWVNAGYATCWWVEGDDATAYDTYCPRCWKRDEAAGECCCISYCGALTCGLFVDQFGVAAPSRGGEEGR